MIEWYIASADDDGTCPKCKQFTFIHRKQMFEDSFWECTNCEYLEVNGHMSIPWSNNACLGYLIKALESIGKSESEIVQIVGAVRGQFDWTTIEEAKEFYNKSNY